MKCAQPTELVCATEIAEELGVVPSAITNWQTRHGTNFPEPWGVWRSGPLWMRDDVEEWYANRLAAKKTRRDAMIARHERELARLRSA